MAIKNNLLRYAPPFFLFNAHLETIYPAVFRTVKFTYQKTEIIRTPDGDCLECALRTKPSDKVVIISHGLEGNLHRPYVRGMAKACFEAGFDVLAWNYRGCGSEMNKSLRFYHSGATDDLDTVVNYVIQTLLYKEINLIGFSLGGNITLKYLGEARGLPGGIKKAVAISVPLDLKTSSEKLSEPSNRIYADRFLKSLKEKVVRKSTLMSGLDLTEIETIKTLKEFDDRYTAPLHGFLNAYDYYDQCSSLRFVNAIQTPTLILNAKNDPFLSSTCFPVDLLRDHPFVRLESPERGGHVGFTQFNPHGQYWSEEKAIEFLTT